MGSLFNKVVPIKFSCEFMKFLRTPILKNLCEGLILNFVFSSNDEQYLIVKLDELGQDIIVFYVYLCYFGNITIVNG